MIWDWTPTGYTARLRIPYRIGNRIKNYTIYPENRDTNKDIRSKKVAEKKRMDCLLFEQGLAQSREKARAMICRLYTSHQAGTGTGINLE